MKRRRATGPPQPSLQALGQQAPSPRPHRHGDGAPLGRVLLAPADALEALREDIVGVVVGVVVMVVGMLGVLGRDDRGKGARERRMGGPRAQEVAVCGGGDVDGRPVPLRGTGHGEGSEGGPRSSRTECMGLC